MSQPEVCIANIGVQQRRRRMISGVGFLAVTLGLILAVVMLNAPLPLRLGIFVPAVVGAAGVLQAREKT